MAYNVRFSDSADADLESIKEYITSQFHNEEAGLNTVQNIILGCRKLETIPLLGFSVQNRTGKPVPNSHDYRGLILGKHIAFYDINGTNIEIDRILSTKENWIFLFS